MSDFANGAARLAGCCAVLLGWPPDVFWRATPAEVAACVAVLTPASERPGDGALLARLREELGDG